MARAHRAILNLENRGQPVNFNTVAETGAVSKDFLYSNAELRILIMHKRGHEANPSVPQPQRTTEASAAVKLQVVTEALERLRTENAQLRQENARLRGEIISNSGRADRI